VPLEHRDCVRIQMHIIPDQMVVSWNLEVTRPEANGNALSLDRVKARFSHSTVRGMLLCKEDLARTQPNFVPELSPSGEARRSILELCNGKRCLAEIELKVYRRHRALFASPGEAAAFVAEVVTRYTV
jgi:hypothetical protein